MSLAVHDQRLTTRVGAVTLVLAASLAIAAMVLERYGVRPSITATVYYANPGTLQEGADIQVASRVIGEVTAISMVPGHRAQDPNHPLHPSGGVAAAIRVQRRYAEMAPINGEYFISAKGLIGKAFIEIGPPLGNGPRARPLRTDDEIRGTDAPYIDRALWRSYQSLMLTRMVVREIAPEARALARALDELAATLRSIEPTPGAADAAATALADFIDEVRAIIDIWAAEDLRWDDIGDRMTRARRLLNRVGAVLDEVQQRITRIDSDLQRLRQQIPDDLPDRLSASLDQARASLAKVNRILDTTRALLAQVERGEGSVGALLTDPEFFDEVKQMSRMLKRNPWRIIGHPPE